MAMTDTEVDEQARPEDTGPAQPVVDLPDPWPKGTDHKYIGSLYVAAAVVFLVAGVVMALLMRAQLSTPDAEILGDRTYRQLFTLHGTFSVFLFLLPVWLGLASAIVPLQVGAARLALPRRHAMSFWVLLTGGVMVSLAPAGSDVL